jgi:hypothetical protein
MPMERVAEQTNAGDVPVVHAVEQRPLPRLPHLLPEKVVR